MAPYSVIDVRDSSIEKLDYLHKDKERRLANEIQQMQSRLRGNPSNLELKNMWTMEAKLEAQFAYRRRLLRTEGFVVRSLSDFADLDTNGSGVLETAELQQFITMRDGDMAAHILQKRVSDLRQEVEAEAGRNDDNQQSGKVNRVQWLLYLTNLHWKVFEEDNVVEQVTEHVKEYRTDFMNRKTLLKEDVIVHPGITRSKAQLEAPDSRTSAQPGERLFSHTEGPGGWGSNYEILEITSPNYNKCCCLGPVYSSGYGPVAVSTSSW